MKSLKLFFMIVLILQQSVILSSQQGMGQQFKMWLWDKWNKFMQYGKPQETLIQKNIPIPSKVETTSKPIGNPTKSFIPQYEIKVPNEKMQEHIQIIEKEIQSINTQIQEQNELIVNRWRELNPSSPENVDLTAIIAASQATRDKEIQRIQEKKNSLTKKHDAFNAAVEAMQR